MTTLSPSQIAASASRAGFRGNDLVVAVAVALAESSGRADVTHKNTNGSTDYGVWQINSIHAELLKGKDWANPDVNAQMAYVIARNGVYWKPWVTFNSGAYLKYMGTAAGAVNAISTPPPTNQPSGIVVTVKSGDTLSGIARAHLGDGNKWPTIWGAMQNLEIRSRRKTPESIQPGDTFFVPGGR